MREDVPLKELLLAVEGELLGADGADLPVALHVLLEAALFKVRREDHLAQWAALVNVTPGGKKRERAETCQCVSDHVVRMCTPTYYKRH